MPRCWNVLLRERKNEKYHFLIVGSGLFGAVFAQQAKAAGKNVLVVEKRLHIAGNVYTEEKEDINVHKFPYKQ